MAFHLYRINELYSDASGTIQFIELAVGNANGESFWSGRTISSTRGGVTHTFTFAGNLPSTATANTTVLLGTRGFADAAGVTPDFVVPDGFLFPAGGSLNFAGVDAVAYPALPADGVHSVSRSGDVADATPRNFAGVTGQLPAPPTPIIGSDGDDLLHSGAGNDAIDGRAGFDTLSYGQAAAGVAVDMRSATATGGAGSDTIAGIERVLGSAFDDTFVGNDLAVGFLGGDGNDTITGGAGDDALQGQRGADTFFATAGDDTLDGGDGLDTAVYALARSAYTLRPPGAGAHAVEKPDAAGTDTLPGTERLKFGDIAVALDLDGHAATVARVLGAVFGRAAVANEVFAGIGLHLVDGGISDESLVQLAIDARLGAGASHLAVIELLYTNVAGVAPSAADAAPFVALLDSQAFTVAGLGVFAAEHELNAASIDLPGLALHGLEYLPFAGG